MCPELVDEIWREPRLRPLDANGSTDVFASGLPLIAAPAVPALSPLGLVLLIVVLLAAGWRLVR